MKLYRRFDYIESQLNAGVPVSHIAKACHVSKTTMYRYVRNNMAHRRAAFIITAILFSTNYQS
ncbi:MAG: hypothetical protein MJY89_01270 [Bacteroidales bacterium]|nr:hypothetical protein [Bacteroidales bacterium]